MKQELKTEIENQIRHWKREKIASIILLVLGILFFWTLIGFIPLILGAIGIGRSNRKIGELRLKLAGG